MSSPHDETTNPRPTGVVTLLFTDIESSTRLKRQVGVDTYVEALELHRSLIDETVHRFGGYVVSKKGDESFSAFHTPRSGLLAAVEAQRAFGTAAWPSGASLRVRMGLHTGLVVHDADDYVGSPVDRASRVCSRARGGQVLVSPAAKELLDDESDLDGVWLLPTIRPLRLKDFPPTVLYSAVAEGIESSLPPPEDAGAPADARHVERLLWIEPVDHMDVALVQRQGVDVVVQDRHEARKSAASQYDAIIVPGYLGEAADAAAAGAAQELVRQLAEAMRVRGPQVPIVVYERRMMGQHIHFGARQVGAVGAARRLSQVEGLLWGEGLTLLREPLHPLDG